MENVVKRGREGGSCYFPSRVMATAVAAPWMELSSISLRMSIFLPAV